MKTCFFFTKAFLSGGFSGNLNGYPVAQSRTDFIATFSMNWGFSQRLARSVSKFHISSFATLWQTKMSPWKDEEKERNAFLYWYLFFFVAAKKSVYWIKWPHD